MACYRDSFTFKLVSPFVGLEDNSDDDDDAGGDDSEDDNASSMCGVDLHTFSNLCFIHRRM
jgi:hypothetical protein